MTLDELPALVRWLLWGGLTAALLGLVWVVNRILDWIHHRKEVNHGTRRQAHPR